MRGTNSNQATRKRLAEVPSAWRTDPPGSRTDSEYRSPLDLNSGATARLGAYFRTRVAPDTAVDAPLGPGGSVAYRPTRACEC